MNGLEEIVLAIKQKAEKQGESIKAAAREKAEEIEQNAKITAKEKSDKIAEEAERKCKQIGETAISAAESERAREILKYKAKTVRDIIDGIAASQNELPDKEYFEVLEKLIYSNYHAKKEGVIRFCEKDLARLPSDFIKKVNEEIGKSGAKLTLGDTVNIKNGFVLCYGDIEENCSFDAIVSSKEDALKDKIAEILFADLEG